MSGPAIFLYDAPEDAPRFWPFSLTRPLGEIRVGAFLLRERWEILAGQTVAGVLVPEHLTDFVEDGAPRAVKEPGVESGPRLLMRSAFIPDAPGPAATGLSDPLCFVDVDGETVGAALPAGTLWPGWEKAAAWKTATINGRRLEGVWELIRELPQLLVSDIGVLTKGQRTRVPAGATVLGDASLVTVEDHAQVEPHVVFDVRNGPVYLSAGVEVRAFTRLSGPLFVGAGTRLVGGQIRESSIGPRCVVHGEVSNCVFLGYANKSHDGFLGHSVVGRWANLGAGTISSNLKNTYGPVRLNLGAERVETGMTFLGSLIGDHAKTAIGTMLPTGCVIGAGANLFGTARPGASVAPFAWGTDEPGRVMACRMFLQTAGRVMPRRDVPVDETMRRYLSSIWRAATGQPCD